MDWWQLIPRNEGEVGQVTKREAEKLATASFVERRAAPLPEPKTQAKETRMFLAAFVIAAVALYVGIGYGIDVAVHAIF